MMSTMCVRMKLSDFINTDDEQEIMDIVNKTHKDFRAVILLHLWYESDDINPNHLRDFLSRWENKLFFKTKVRHNSKLEPSEFIFYEICPKDLDVSKYRFKYSYDTTQDIVRGLKQFYDCVKFITQDKPIKKQKRNDYED